IRAAEKHPPIEIIITRCEEIGSLGAKNLDFSLLSSKYAYVLDMDSPDELVVGEATHIHIDVTYTGKSAHSGVEPENGLSSILTAVEALHKMKLGRLDAESTSNVGVFQGGEARNIIPEQTKLQAECRSLDHKKALKIADEMESIFIASAKESGAKVDIVRDIVSSGYRIDKDDEVVKLYASALKKNGIEPDIKNITAGTDAALFNEKGVKAVVVGIGCRKIHSKEEYAIISEMEVATRTLISLVEGLA
ncbi:MAG TPA: M20/M25/M40 family metallo-hydrolase, partial [bacterium]|nr:M20/M25/M40 family metallo-hydrolase [bacterium]